MRCAALFYSMIRVALQPAPDALIAAARRSVLLGRSVAVKRSPLEDGMGTILLIILILLLIGALPTWPYSTGWGYYPSGGLGLVVLIIIILLLLGRI
jgi:hypothetical protein